MNIFRKFHFLSVTFILFTFLSFSRYTTQALILSEQSTSKGDIKFTLLHSISSEFLLPSIERTQNIQILPVLKCYTEGHSFIEFKKTLPVSERINHIPFVSIASNSILLEQICKLQIWFSFLFPLVNLLIQVLFDGCPFGFNYWNSPLLNIKKHGNK